MRANRVIAGISVLCLLMMVGCGESTPQDTTKELVGKVSNDAAVEGANLEIYDSQGRQLATLDNNATNHVGAFRITVINLPTDFRIVATVAGSVDASGTAAVFSADYRDFDPTTGVAYLNPVTTMITAYIDNHPDKTLAEATAIVKNFLEIPDWFDIGEGLTPANKYFNPSAFIDDALQNGGMNSYVTQLIVEIDAAGATAVTHPFPPGPPLVQGVAGGIGGAVASAAVGYGLKEMGIYDPDAELTDRLKDMQATLIDMNNKLNDIMNELTALEKQMTIDTYGTRVGQTNDRMADLMTVYRNYRLFILTPPPTKARREADMNEIVEEIGNKIISDLDYFQLQLFGSGAGEENVLKLWNKVVKDKYRFARSDVVNSAIQRQFDYFKEWQGIALLLTVEYYHAKGEDALDTAGYHLKHPLIYAPENTAASAACSRTALLKPTISSCRSPSRMLGSRS